MTTTTTTFKIRYFNNLRCTQIKSAYQHIDDSPHTYNHKQTNDAINHQVFHLVSPVFVFSRRNIFSYAVYEKHHRKTDKQRYDPAKNQFHNTEHSPQICPASLYCQCGIRQQRYPNWNYFFEKFYHLDFSDQFYPANRYLFLNVGGTNWQPIKIRDRFSCQHPSKKRKVFAKSHRRTPSQTAR